MKKGKSTINTHPDKEVTVYERTASDILKITEDKLILKLTNLKISIESKSNIFCYMGMIITIVIVLLTTNFKEWILRAELWQAIFIIGLVVLVLLTLRSLISYCKKRKDINSIISDIKEGK